MTATETSPTTEPTTGPGPAVGRFASLEGYRGLAALAIVVYHVYQYAAVGNPGMFGAVSSFSYRVLHGLDAFVDLFFVLSAFLLTLPYARAALRGEPSPSGRSFAARRAARILPLYVVAVTVVWAIRNPVLPGDLLDLVEHLTFTQVLDDRRIFWTIGPAWSLAVEVHFYVLLAVLGWAACHRAARLRRPGARLALLLGGTGVLAAAGLAWKVVAWFVLDVPETRWSVWFSLPAKLDVFAVGMLLAVVVARWGAGLSRAGAALLRVGAGAVLLADFVTRPQAAGDQVWFHSIAAVGFALLLASSLTSAHPGGGRVLAGRALTFLGLISYSLYLWHEPVFLGLAAIGWLPAQTSPRVFVVGLLLLVPAAVGVAWLSWRLVERPAARLGLLVDRSGRSRDYYDGS